MPIERLSSETFFIASWYLFVIFLHGTIRIIVMFLLMRRKTEEEINRDYLTPSNSASALWINHKILSSIIWGVFGLVSTSLMILSLICNILYNTESIFTTSNLIKMLVILFIALSINFIEINFKFKK